MRKRLKIKNILEDGWFKPPVEISVKEEGDFEEDDTWEEHCATESWQGSFV